MTMIGVVQMQGYKGEFIECKRVMYGKKDTPRKYREYKSGDSPVGTIEEWGTMARQLGKYAGVVFEDIISHERVIMKFGPKADSITILNHDTKTVQKLRKL